MIFPFGTSPMISGEELEAKSKFRSLKQKHHKLKESSKILNLLCSMERENDLAEEYG